MLDSTIIKINTINKLQAIHGLKNKKFSRDIERLGERLAAIAANVYLESYYKHTKYGSVAEARALFRQGFDAYGLPQRLAGKVQAACLEVLKDWGLLTLLQ